LLRERVNVLRGSFSAFAFSNSFTTKIESKIQEEFFAIYLIQFSSHLDMFCIEHL
jgi:hypothetical protein